MHLWVLKVVSSSDVTDTTRRRLRVAGKTSSGLIVGARPGQGRTRTSEDAHLYAIIVLSCPC